MVKLRTFWPYLVGCAVWSAWIIGGVLGWLGNVDTACLIVGRRAEECGSGKVLSLLISPPAWVLLIVIAVGLFFFALGERNRVRAQISELRKQDTNQYAHVVRDETKAALKEELETIGRARRQVEEVVKHIKEADALVRDQENVLGVINDEYELSSKMTYLQTRWLDSIQNADRTANNYHLPDRLDKWFNAAHALAQTLTGMGIPCQTPFPAPRYDENPLAKAPNEPTEEIDENLNRYRKSYAMHIALMEKAEAHRKSLADKIQSSKDSGALRNAVSKLRQYEKDYGIK
ncbi:hypothetical protein QQS45_11585 [Alteriqipengyuania flavescens]|uniref:hypothetical protein n=1 Tax=Alteriqipengyuania flavescens TaxID=3053610 RepID=UPI0025B2B145|nr:hypothetical protein [Alteriqipengyuania flavescens]WJY18255.1 hypothetical protein QQW98_11580 [Alteriqipengyuania flavescens]WJY24196.1 hypothetical protein QQS45_11585 [Alteriqipengyuania flavescens]